MFSLEQGQTMPLTMLGRHALLPVAEPDQPSLGSVRVKRCCRPARCCRSPPLLLQEHLCIRVGGCLPAHLLLDA